MTNQLIIKNAGYMWHRKYIDWQNGSELIGYPEDKKGHYVNFAYQAGIYALYNSNFDCVYIGQAGGGDNTGLFHRLKDHLNDHLFCMWERFSWYGFYSTKTVIANTDDAYNNEFETKITVDINELIDIFETVCINMILPRHNKKDGNNIASIEWYYQPAEYEEQKAQLNQLKKVCKSLGDIS